MKRLTIFPLRFGCFVIKIKLVLNILAKLCLACFKTKLIDKNRILSRMKILQCIQNDVVFDFNDAIGIAHCIVNIESTQPAAILNFEWTL